MYGYTTRGVEVETSRSQVDPSEEALEDTSVSNMEMEWSEATSIRIYETSHPDLEANKKVNFTAMEEELDEIVSEIIEAKLLRLKASERKTTTDFRQKGIEEEII